MRYTRADCFRGRRRAVPAETLEGSPDVGSFCRRGAAKETSTSTGPHNEVRPLDD
jgi:hypothetical protein